MEDAVPHYTPTQIKHYAKPVPRYTSYPTAPHFNEAVQDKTVRKWMATIPADEAISLYIHIPFCDRLCWFCGCHTKHTLKYEPVRRYLQTVYNEIRLVGSRIGRQQTVAHLHLGGGSPSLLKPEDLADLKRVLLENFHINPSTEISLEFDPTDLDKHALRAFAGFGVTRASLGVQDFDPLVQATINRPQSFEQTKFVVDTLREQGVISLNIDALYGLPHQTLTTLEDTLHSVISLSPDRIALFGYAHVPWVKPHQKMIPENSLPDNMARFKQARFAETVLKDAGYVAIGFDHFAKPTDSLAQGYKAGTVRRNFQGYTTDACPTLIGLGVSSISQFAQGYAQNVKDTHSYRRAIEAGDLPTQRGIAVGPHDAMVASAINELMCYFTLSKAPLRAAYGDAADMIISRAQRIAHEDENGYFKETASGFALTDSGRPFVRTYAALFDDYIAETSGKYSVAV
ncbi:oxygen-independent coproporphyrinogen III oxidase [Fretibacter rubidus]|uniref:oxygen-independent coproporphyrinogen III oxidase n=1 Tax=Fretibacter rubidus TaxID=570162 RepID=UPI00352B07AF